MITAFAIFVVVIIFRQSSHADSIISSHADWDNALYNPSPTNNDEILPMPCGGKIVFRKVEAESEGLYGDQAILMGDATIEEDFYKSYPTKAYIAGGFESNTKGRRYLLMGKYEITQLQYISIMKDVSSDCPEPNETSTLPQTNINWFDAIEFTKRYSLWLQHYYLQNGGTPLPKKGQELGFVRLPTEIEWEFSARGGLLTKSKAEYQSIAFFSLSGEPTNQYAWYAGSESANGKLHKIGLLKPNPLGLYDILGNADEIVFDLFHLSHPRTNHMHGETGGFVVRGGNYQDDAQKIYSARREEIPFFSEGKLHSGASSTGFRVVVAASVIGANVSQLTEAWRQLSSTSTLATTATHDEQPFQLVSKLSEKTEDTALKNQLNDLSVELNAQKANYDAQLSRAAREALRTASILCQKLNDDNQRLIVKEKNYVDFNCKQATNEYNDFCNKIQLEHNREVYHQNKGFYADAILNLSGFNLDIVKQQKERWVQEIETKEFTHIKPYPDLVYTQVEQYVKTNKTEIENWNKSCTDIKPQI
jgi:Sulfatase-modifying factor enzyme 1